jgi:hypothetical protein
MGSTILKEDTMITKNAVVTPGYTTLAEAKKPDRLLVVTETEEVFDGLFIVSTKEVGKIDPPVERWWDWALEEVPT